MKVTIEVSQLAELITLASSAMLVANGMLKFISIDRAAIAMSKRVIELENEIVCVADLHAVKDKSGQVLFAEGCGVIDVEEPKDARKGRIS